MRKPPTASLVARGIGGELEETTIIEGSFATRVVLAGPEEIGHPTPPSATSATSAPTDTPIAAQTTPPATLGDGRGEVPGGDLGAKENAVERASARRGVGRQPRLKPAESNAKTTERRRTVLGGILQRSLREMSCRQDISYARLTTWMPGRLV